MCQHSEEGQKGYTPPSLKEGGAWRVSCEESPEVFAASLDSGDVVQAALTPAAAIRLSEPMHITCNEDTYELIKDDFVFEELGPTEVKGFGTQNLYSLEAERGHTGL